MLFLPLWINSCASPVDTDLTRDDPSARQGASTTPPLPTTAAPPPVATTTTTSLSAATTSWTTTTTLLPLPEEFGFNFDAGISGDSQERIRFEIKKANSFLLEHFDVSIAQLQTFFSHDAGYLESGYREYVGVADPNRVIGGMNGAAAVPGAFFLNLTTIKCESGDQQCSTTLAHELFHVVQFEIAKTDLQEVRETGGAPSLGPAWLTEGMAEYAGHKYGFIFNYGEAIDVTRLTSAGKDVSLGDIERFVPGEQFRYDIAWLAGDWLAEEFGPKSFVTYSAAIGDGLDWREAFATTFGMDVEAFYEIFRESVLNASAGS